MLMTVQNISGRTINKLDDTYYFVVGSGGPASLNATSDGHRKDPLPYPFAHIGQLANLATKQLPLHERDMRNKSSQPGPLQASEEWNQLVQAGVVALTLAAQPGTTRDVEDALVHDIAI